MGETEPVGQALEAAKAARRVRSAPARTAVALGVATFALTVLHQALEPAHISVWVSRRG